MPALKIGYARVSTDGNVAAVWREARDGGCEPPPLRTLQVAFARTLGEDANADGRALLLRLSAWHLWLEHDEPGT